MQTSTFNKIYIFYYSNHFSLPYFVEASGCSVVLSVLGFSVALSVLGFSVALSVLGFSVVLSVLGFFVALSVLGFSVALSVLGFYTDKIRLRFLLRKLTCGMIKCSLHQVLCLRNYILSLDYILSLQQLRLYNPRLSAER